MFRAQLEYTESDLKEWRVNVAYGVYLMLTGASVAAILYFVGVKTFWFGVALFGLGLVLALWSGQATQRIRRNLGKPILRRVS